jgi:Arc/MetJ-type ribon-helix-helix transcriptional regulator
MAFPEENKVVVERKEDGVIKVESVEPPPAEEPKGTIEEITSSVRELARNFPESIGKLPGSIGAAIQNVLSTRDLNLSVSVSDDALKSIEMLVEAGIFASRSDAAAFLIGEGIKAKQELFTQVTDKIDQIQKLKAELKTMTNG